MNGSEPKIEILKPFSEAFQLMKTILFHPFDLAKWCVIGFAAFLANFSSGMNFNFGFNGFPRNGNWHWSYSEARRGMTEAFNQIPVWVMPLATVGILVIVAIVILVMWLGARGRFILTDCLVHNRGAFTHPWREFRSEGNSFFLFSLLVLIAALILCSPFLAPLFIPGLRLEFGPVLIGGIILYAMILMVISFAWQLVSQLMVPVMYHRRCRSLPACKEVIALIGDNPIPFILYLLFFVVLVVACAIVGCVVTCVTCCIAAIPYIGTVILLPLYLTLYGFTLFFIKQFGTNYDVWAGVLPIEQPPPPLEPPPLQA